MFIAVDANILLSALLGGKPSIILFDTRFHFITTEFTIDEVEKYLPHYDCHLWSQDKDFERAGYAKILKTHHFFNGV
ncbi:MAG: hypothetical protein HYV33_04820 [Candidatus Kerfeldbacteria bacterium]|nr:hypothetical protein [Candidatus Kerfeldbacteria bacterium]